MDSPKKHWLDDRSNVNKIILALAAACLVMLLTDLLYHKHVHFEFEHWFGFFGLFGFVASLVLVLVARLARVVLRRGEDYYDQ